jgi:hypothetical protein
MGIVRIKTKGEIQMGREIRKVPLGWEHPSEAMLPWQLDNGYHRYHKPGEFGYGLKFQPMYDNDIESKWREWKEELDQWLDGQHAMQIKFPGEEGSKPTYANFVGWEGRSPDPDSYRSEVWTAEEANCYQIYETVSEGTPVSPVFETLDEMEQWLIGQGYSEAAAKGFCKIGWVPSGMFSPQTGIVTGIEIAGMKDGE